MALAVWINVQAKRPAKDTQNQALSDEEIYPLTDDNDFTSNESPMSQEELFEKLSDSFFTKNDRVYTTALQYLQNDSCNAVFKDVLFEKLRDGELGVYYDYGTINDTALFLAYKIANEVLCLYLIKDTPPDKFALDKYSLSVDSVGEEVRLSKRDIAQLAESLREYNRLHENIFELENNLK